MQFKDIRTLLLAEVDDSLEDLLDSSNDTKAEFNTCVLVYIQNISKIVRSFSLLLRLVQWAQLWPSLY